MLFYLTTLNLARFLHEEAPALKEDETNKQVVATVEAWKHADFLCRNYILNGLDITLYNDFKNYLKHKRKEMELEDLIVRLRIEEDNRASEKKAGKTFTEAKANVMEQGQNSKKRKNSPSGPKQSPNDNKKFKGKCYVCDKLGHRTKDCHLKKPSEVVPPEPAPVKIPMTIEPDESPLAGKEKAFSRNPVGSRARCGEEDKVVDELDEMIF
ncbi:hypothetical protein AAC387_Pa07g1291 [Persea americana]